MKSTLFGVATLCLILLTACEPECDPSLDERVGDEMFTVEYKTPGGKNFLNEVYDLSNVVVYLDTAGSTNPLPKFELIKPGYKDGKFGPFSFTERYINQARNEVNSVLLYGETLRFDYFFRKDTYGVDTLTVTFRLGASVCNTYWDQISYSLNGELLPAYENQQQPQIVITEEE